MNYNHDEEWWIPLTIAGAYFILGLMCVCGDKEDAGYVSWLCGGIFLFFFIFFWLIKKLQ